MSQAAQWVQPPAMQETWGSILLDKEVIRLQSFIESHVTEQKHKGVYVGDIMDSV